MRIAIPLVVVIVAAALGSQGCLPTATPPGNQPDSGVTAPSGTPLPCDVQAALGLCRSCHTTPLAGGAPMPLDTWDDMQQASITNPSMKVYQMVGQRISAGTMPPAPLTMSAEAKTTLLNWIQAGAPAGTVGQTCDGTSSGNVYSGVGPQYLPCTPNYTFTAHDPIDPTQGFPIPTGGSHNFYECFTFKSPWKPGEQGQAFAPIIDQKAQLHHWILWETTNPNPHPDGSVFICGAFPDAQSKFLSGWAPGSENFVMPDNIGMHLDQGSTLYLQVHYYNPNDIANLRDKSGVAVCTTSGRPQEAGIMAVGPTYPTSSICADVSPDQMSLCVPPHTTKTIVGTCDWSNIVDSQYTWSGNVPPGGFDVLASLPHMHLIGTAFTTNILRANGTVDPLVHVDPFDFNTQTIYPFNPPIHVNPGDKLQTSCTYDNQSNSTVYLGEKTTDEMCFNFMVITPFPSYNGGMMTCPVPGLPATWL